MNRFLLLLALLVLPLVGLAERPPAQSTPPANWAPAVAKLQSLGPAGQATDVAFGVLPGQWPGAALWSGWGDAEYAADGKFYVSLGDHHAPHGHSFVYCVDPVAKTIELVVDVTALLGVKGDDQYAPGKIHGPLIDGGDGWLYFATYRGALKHTTAAQGYHGDHLFRYQLATRQVEDLGIPVPEASHPAYRLYRPTMTLYGLSQPGANLPKDEPCKLYLYDLRERRLKFHGGPAANVARALIVDQDGNAWYSTTVAAGKGVFARYDSRTNEVALTPAVVPDDGVMRAASRVDAHGLAYGITNRNGLVFSLNTKTAEVRPLASVVGDAPEGQRPSAYTAVVRLDPTDRFLYCVPGAHGGAEQAGSPVVQINVQTGERKVIAALNDLCQAKVGYVPLGTFGLALASDGRRLLVNWNGCYADWRTGPGRQLSFSTSRAEHKFDVGAVTILDLPENER